MKRVLRCIAMGALVAGLVACGPPRKSVFPPAVSIQEMNVRPDGQWRLTLRIQNNSYSGMGFHSIEGELKVADGVPVRLHHSFDLDIPAFAGDVTQIDVLPTTEMNQALKAVAAKGSAGSLPYSVIGHSNAKPEQEKENRDFDFHGSGWLSPVPGISNTYR
ncbi:hypothetical protein [Dyella tabacisoli]|uniref:Late embryogenesis abundant protein LEA-2 subgroup domain-containing protein n=1 Tax=Dyella tabacisoli TaxID=2282381 RepID=A0A369ULI5_9GAMM|nr:hypothetical protein [Dyella tabacisoli]RDD80460.1 hypothetical protein DVJ77_16285 [Dyella tabacisoli]